MASDSLRAKARSSEAFFAFLPCGSRMLAKTVWPWRASVSVNKRPKPVLEPVMRMTWFDGIEPSRGKHRGLDEVGLQSGMYRMEERIERSADRQKHLAEKENGSHGYGSLRIHSCQKPTPPESAPTISDAERAAAAAGGLHVRVIELEAGAFEGLDIVDFHALEIHRAHLIDGDFQAVEIHHFIGIVGLVFKGHVVLKTRTAAADNGDTQGRRYRRLHSHDFLDLAGGYRREINHNKFGLRTGNPASKFIIAWITRR